jgi:hypothetical protein
MASREPQRPEIDANRRREPLKRINLSGQLALMGETRRFRPFFRKLLSGNAGQQALRVDRPPSALSFATPISLPATQGQR